MRTAFVTILFVDATYMYIHAHMHVHVGRIVMLHIDSL